jgi:molybdopterin molybdotransferase
MLLEIEQALERINAVCDSLPAQTLPASNALHCILAEHVYSDIDSPPHDKSIVDGYALRAEDCTTVPTVLKILEEITAGQVPTLTVTSGTATRIMTGAPIPNGTNAVVMVEKTELPNEQEIAIHEVAPRVGQNIMRKGTSLQCGQLVLETGKQLRSIELGLLAEIGRVNVQVIPQPRVAVLATGNELVEAQNKPGAGEIRNSNSPLLCGLVQAAGGVAIDLGIGRDNVAHLQSLCAAGLRENVLVISGGVSAGVLDLIPHVLTDLGVQCVFHKVNLKPGKPLWFGKLTTPQHECIVFGLPGNPVSSLVCFELFVRPVLQKLAGKSFCGMQMCHATLTTEFVYRGGRRTLHPAKFNSETKQVTPLTWRGSGDLFTLTHANAFIEFQGDARTLTCGQQVNIYLF